MPFKTAMPAVLKVDQMPLLELADTSGETVISRLKSLGRMNVELMRNELMLDNSGFCRFHRSWAQEMVPDLVERLFGCGAAFSTACTGLTRHLTRVNQSVFWEPRRNLDFVASALAAIVADSVWLIASVLLAGMSISGSQAHARAWPG